MPSATNPIESNHLQACGITLTHGNCCHHSHDHQVDHSSLSFGVGKKGCRLYLAPRRIADAAHERDGVVVETTVDKLHVPSPFHLSGGSYRRRRPSPADDVTGIRLPRVRRNGRHQERPVFSTETVPQCASGKQHRETRGARLSQQRSAFDDRYNSNPLRSLGKKREQAFYNEMQSLLGTFFLFTCARRL